MNRDNALLSIGALSRISGVGVETLRNWERRYGFPEPIRLDSGHRRYPSEMVTRLRIVRRAIDLGFKPSYAVLAPTDELEGLVREAENEALKSETGSVEIMIQREIDHWLDRTQALDAHGFEVAVRRAWSQFGARDFVVKLAVPYLVKVGERWFEQQFSVAHEHFTSENLSSFFAAQWHPISERAGSGKAVVANLEGEQHHLGIHMAAVFLALNDFEVIFLGPSTPLPDITVAAREAGVVTVVIGLSKVYNVQKAEKALAKLRQSLPTSITIVAGGNELLKDIKGITQLNSLDAFADFARSLSEIYRGA
jgi:MerR family transcriptional regulator, light-induced transcriptional regulator